MDSGKCIRSEQLRIDWRQLMHLKRTLAEPVMQSREEGFLEAESKRSIGALTLLGLGGEMSTWQLWLQHPERVWVRKFFFYMHLWVGAGVGLYIVLMSITGSLIVYRNELERTPSFVSSVEWIVDLHENLLFGRNGRFVNGIGAISVILLCSTGAVIWWPGTSNWRRALTVNWRSPSARFSWDLHSALGFWSFLFVLMWGISGFYFVFPQTFNSLFGLIDCSDHFIDQTSNWLSLLHFGRFGLFSEAVWTLLGLVPALLSVTGVFLCCRRMILKAQSVRPY
jgi:uncharacterized iron-regulated membrane protein